MRVSGLLAPLLQEAARPVLESAAAGGHQLTEGETLLPPERAARRRLLRPVLQAVAVVRHTVVAEAGRVGGRRLGEQQVVQQAGPVRLEAETLGEIEQGAKLPVGLRAEQVPHLGRPRRPWRALAIDPAGRSL